MKFWMMADVELSLDIPEMDDVAGTLRQCLENRCKKIKTNDKIGIAVGSRGIYGLEKIVHTVIRFVQDEGAYPVIIPAMGSHGGATAKGQIEVLAAYGLSEERLGIPVAASMETQCIGYVETNIPVYVSSTAMAMDGVILINRIKPHTDFRGEFESGLMKLMAIGLGCHQGAQNIHSYGISRLSSIIPASGKLILKNAPIMGGVAILENIRDHTTDIDYWPANEIEMKEPQWLIRAKELLLSLPLSNVDVLIIEEMGKNISGVGIDPNVTMRPFIRAAYDWGDQRVRRIVCLDLTEETHGNAQGMGIADVITRRFYDKIDFDSTYVNVKTNGRLELALLPLVVDTEEEAVDLALRSCERKIDAGDERIIQIQNTLDISRMFVTLPLLRELIESGLVLRYQLFTYAFTRDGEIKIRLKKRVG